MSLLDLLIGSGPGQRLVILGTFLLYGYLVVRRPDDARESARNGARMLVKLGTLVVAALFLASAVGTLLPDERLSERLGDSARLREVVVAGVVAGLLPGGPYATYPIIKRVQESGANTPTVLTMLLGYGLIGIGRVPYGLVFFSPTVVGLRLLTAGAATVGVGAALFAVGGALGRRSTVG